MIGFVAYVCSNASNRVGAYSLLELTDYPITGQHHKIEMVQIKRDRTVPVFCRTVIESVMSQYCRFYSLGGIIRYLSFRESRKVEAWDCRSAKMMGKMSVRILNGPWVNHLSLYIPHW